MSSDRREGPAQLAHPTEFDELFGRAYPNPDRVGCPPRDVLVSLARREQPIGDPAYDHIKECSPCYLEGRAIQETDALQQRRRIQTWAAAAVIALAAGTGAWILTARSGSVDAEIQAQLDLRPYAIMRSETPTAERPPLQLPRRRRVLLTLLLPTGSEPGPYEVEIRDAGAVSRASARGDADLRNQRRTEDVTRLKANHRADRRVRAAGLAFPGFLFTMRLMLRASDSPMNRSSRLPNCWHV
jgi:hypothetical protein